MHKLREIRESLQMTQEEFAAHIGVSRKYLGNLEHQKTSPRLVTLNSIALALQMSLHDLIEEGKYRCKLRGDPIMLCGHPQSLLRHPHIPPGKQRTQYCTACAHEAKGKESERCASMDREILEKTPEKHR